MGAKKKKALRLARKAEKRALAKVVEQNGHHAKETKKKKKR